MLVEHVTRMSSLQRLAGRLAAHLSSENAGDVIRVALWLGILFGLAEASIDIYMASVRHLSLGHPTIVENFWTAPLAAATSLVLLASVLLLLTGVLPDAPRWRGAIAPICVVIGTYFVLRLLRVGISPTGALILAAGVATLVLRVRRARATATTRLVRRTLPALVGGVVAFALAIGPWQRWREQKSVGGLSPSAPGKPNVLMIIWDTARALDFSLYGYERETTPELTRFASAGTTFTRAISAAPWTLPSHASMFTGRYPFELSAGWESPLDGTFPTVAEVFTRHGYAAGAFVANRFYLTPEFGLQRGFTTFSYSADIDPGVIFTTWSFSREVLRAVRERFGNHSSVDRRTASAVNDAFVSWLGRVGDRPFFGVINHIDAHAPYFPPSPYNLAFAKQQPRYWADEEFRLYPPETLSQLRDAYDGSLKYLDHELGRLLRELKSRGLLDNTIVVVTSDHGEELGAHSGDVISHGTTLFTTSTLVPLVLVYPLRIRANHRANENVSTRDIAATLIDLAGLRPDVDFPGESLVPLADRDSLRIPASRPILSMTEKRANAGMLPSWSAGHGELFSVALGDLHYIRDAKRGEHVYNLSRDIWEKTDLAATPEGSAAIERFRKILDSAIVQPAGALRARFRKNVK